MPQSDAPKGAWQRGKHKGTWQKHAKEYTKDLHDTMSFVDIIAWSLYAMSPGTGVQGAWQGSTTKQGAWQQQAVAHSGTIADTMTAADAIVLSAEHVIADSMTGAETIILDAEVAIQDSMTGADTITVKDAEKVLTDAMTGADTISVKDAEKALSDAMTGVDAIVEEAERTIADSMTGTDGVVADAEIVLNDSMTAVDVLSVSGAQAGLITDQMTITEEIVKDATVALLDGMTAVDSLTGVLTVDGGVIDPDDPAAVAVSDIETPVAARRKQPTQGVKDVNTQALPVTSVAISSSNTTFTTTGVTDASAWDLTDVDVGDVVVVGDEHMGFVTGKSTNQVNVEGWIRRGVSRRGKDPDRPDDAQAVTVFKRLLARQIILCSVGTNTKPIYMGFDQNVTPVNGHPISHNSGQPNATLDIEAPPGKLINLSQIWVIAGSDQQLKWQTDTLHALPGEPPEGYVENVQTLTIEDSMTAVDSIAAVHAEIFLSDEMTGIDRLGIAQSVVQLGDAMAAQDVISSEAEIVSDGSKLTDSMTAAEQLAALAIVGLSDGMTGIDSLSGVLTPGSVPTLELADVMVGNDQIVGQAASKLITDSMTGGDQVQKAASKTLSDVMSGADALTGILSSLLPGETFGFNDVHVEINAGGSGADLMYCAISRAAGSGIMVYNVIPKWNPTRYAWLPLPETPIRLAMNWPVLYATSTTGLYSILCTPLPVPTQIDYIALQAPTSPGPRVAIWPNRAYVNTLTSGLKIINIFDPANMVEIAGHDFDIAAMGNYLYPNWTDAVNTWNPPNPAHDYFYGIYAPSPTGDSWGYQNCFLYDGGIDIKVDASYIYLDNGRVVWKLTRSDSPSLVWVHTCMITQVETGLSNSFDVDSGQIYANQRGTGGTNHQFQMPSSAAQSFNDNCIMTKGAATMSYGKTFYESARRLAYICRDDGLSIVDTIPAGEVLSLERGYGSRGVWANANNFYLCVWEPPTNHRVEIYDITSPYNPGAPYLRGTAT